MPEDRAAPSDTDSSLYSLTQIRHLMRVEFSRAQRYGYPVACAMLAVDGLSHLRDRHGYDAKEEILERVAVLLRGETRGCDYLGRLVDERLLAVLPHTGAGGVATAAARWVARARSLDVRARGARVPITISVGTTHFELGNAMYFDQLLDAAELALADAAAQGGDRALHRAPGRS